VQVHQPADSGTAEMQQSSATDEVAVPIDQEAQPATVNQSPSPVGKIGQDKVALKKLRPVGLENSRPGGAWLPGP
jgi:hypothetical protein